MESYNYKNLYTYNLITPKQKIENDKERLLYKFSFNISKESIKKSGSLKKLTTIKKESSLLIHNSKNSRSRNKTKKNSSRKEQKNIIQIYRINRKIQPVKITKNQIPKIGENLKNNHTLNTSMNNSNKVKKINKENKNEKGSNLRGYLMKLISEKNISSIMQNENSQSFSNSNNNSIIRNYIVNLNKKKSGSCLIDNHSSFFSTSQKLYFPTQTQETFLRDDLEDTKYEKIEDENVKINKLTYFKKRTNNIEEKKEEEKSINKSSFSMNSDNSELNGDNIGFKMNYQYSNIKNINNVNNSNIANNSNNVNNSNNINNSSFNNTRNDISTINTYKKLRGFIFNKETERFQVTSFLKKFSEEESAERKITEVNNSQLLDDDEYTKKNKDKMVNNSTKFRFISDIVDKNNSIVTLSYEKYMNLSSKAKLIIFSFVFDNYYQLNNISKSFRKNINDFLNEKFKYIILDFKLKYNKLFHLDKYYFDKYSIQKNSIKPKIKLNKSFSLFLKAKIIKDNEYIKKKKNISFELSYNFKIKNKKNDTNRYNSYKTLISNNTYSSKNHKIEQFTEIFQFDLRKNKFFPMWIYCEKNDPNDDFDRKGIKNNESNTFIIDNLMRKKHLVYSSPVINVCEDDFVIFEIEIIKNNNIIERVNFNDLKENLAQIDYYQNQLFRQSHIFDGIRDCEIEKMINQWHEFSILNNGNKIKEYINNIIKLFHSLFEVISIKYDKSNFFFFKIVLKAIKIGKIAKNFLVNKNILIVDENASIAKECVNINLINTFSLHNDITIRKGTLLIFYLSE